MRSLAGLGGAAPGAGVTGRLASLRLGALTATPRGDVAPDEGHKRPTGLIEIRAEPRHLLRPANLTGRAFGGALGAACTTIA